MMLKKVRFFLCVLCAAAILLLALVVYFNFLASSSLTSALPRPSDSRPYVLIDTKDGNYPKAVSALFTDGMYALLRSGTSRNMLLTLAEKAEDAAILIDEEDEGITEVYASLRFTSSEMRRLTKGELPDSWKAVFKSPRVEQGHEKNTWILAADNISSPIYFKAERKRLITAGDPVPFKKLIEVDSGKEKGLGRKKWNEEKKWPGHIEICDGGLLFNRGEKASPLKLRAAWHKLDPDKSSGKAGEAKWTIEGLDKRIDSSILNAFKAKKWDTENCIIPSPLLLSMGLNIPNLKGKPADWPFPLSTIGELGRSMELSDSQIHKILSGQMVFSLGGHNKILWFTLPGFMAEFTGKRALMTDLVTAFWDKLFSGAKPRSLDGFEYGGTTNLPFSVIGAGRGDMAILGLMSPESIRSNNKLGTFLNDGKAIGWIIADMPRVGAALSDMTKMNSLMENKDTEDDEYSDSSGGGEPFQPDPSFSPFDQGITDSFSNVLRGLGKVLIVWEKPESGSISWFMRK